MFQSFREVHVWAAIDVETGELLAIDTLYQRSEEVQQ